MKLVSYSLMKIQISDILRIFGDTVLLLENWLFYFVKNAGKNKGVFPVEDCSKNSFKFRTLFWRLPFRRHVLLIIFCMYADYQVSVPSGRNELMKTSGPTRVILT